MYTKSPASTHVPPCIIYTFALVVAPIAAPLDGIKKSLAGIFPSAPRAPLSVAGSTLLKLESDHVPEFQLLPDCLTPDAVMLTCDPVFETAILEVKVELELRMLKPLSPFFHAVLRVKVKLPGLPLSIKPFFAFWKAMQFLMMWFAGGLSVIPSLKPFPSPLKSLKDQRFTPLPHA